MRYSYWENLRPGAAPGRKRRTTSATSHLASSAAPLAPPRWRVAVRQLMGWLAQAGRTGLALTRTSVGTLRGEAAQARACTAVAVSVVAPHASRAGLCAFTASTRSPDQGPSPVRNEVTLEVTSALNLESTTAS